MTNWEDRVFPGTVQDRTAYDHDMYGVEIEVEWNQKDPTFNIPKALQPYWAVVNDGSLRSHGHAGDTCAEFRYAKPLGGHLSAAAVIQLCSVINDHAKVYESGRTSTHVHVNILNITKLQVMNLITLSVIFDEFLVSQHHPSRSGNLFALRFVDAEWPIRGLVSDLKMGRNIKYFANANQKYGSVNLTSIGKFGTIEYRSMDGELNSQRINNWVFCLEQLKSWATKYKNPQEIIERFHALGPLTFLRRHVPTCYTLNAPLHETVEKLMRGVILASDLAFACDWVSTKSEDKPKTYNTYMVSNEMLNSLMAAQAAQAPQPVQSSNFIPGAWGTMPSSSQAT